MKIQQHKYINKKLIDFRKFNFYCIFIIYFNFEIMICAS